MIILGLDLSIHSTGFFICNDNKEILECGTIKNATKLQQYEKVKQLVKKYKVTNVAIEDIFYSKNVKTMKDLAIIHGAIALLFDKLIIPYKYYSVMTVKSVALKVQGTNVLDASGKRKKGDELKREVQKAMFIIFGKFCNEKELDLII